VAFIETTAVSAARGAASGNDRATCEVGKCGELRLPSTFHVWFDTFRKLAKLYGLWFMGDEEHI
jgi:hypothetical protein